MSVDRTHQPLKLRPYQREALDALDNAWSGARRPSGTGVVTRPAVVLPTGMGKTVIFAELIARALSKKQRPLILVHREELAKQAAEKIHSAVPGASIGIVKADRNETGADIIVGSVQTLAKPARREQVRDIGLGIVDECHHAAARTWRETMAYFGAWDRTPWAGFTATMSRSDGGHLGDIWEEVVIKRDIMDGIRGGYLVNVKGKRIKVMDLDLDEVKRSRGDMQAGDLGDAMMDADAGNTIAKACREHAADRQGVIFAPTVPTAYQFAQDMRDAGFTCEVIEGDTPEDERTAIYERYRTGATQWLSNCMVLTEGWDAPWSSCAVIARPTESAALYIQMVGRVLRPWAAGGKTDALVLDVVGVSERHRLATMADLTTSPVRPPRDDDDEWSLSDEVESVESAKAQAGDPLYLSGELVASDVDLFSQSESSWLQTTGGVWFIPGMDAYFFLWPRGDGLFTLGRQNSRGGKATKLEDDLTLEYGMSWAERYSSDEDQSSGVNISGRSASWRRRKPSEKLLNYAIALGIPTEGLRQGELSNLISVKKASAMLDR